MKTTAYQLASRFVGIQEVPGSDANPAILAMLKLDDAWPQDDSVPWCSAFVNYITWLLRLPRSKSLRARSWLNVGKPINILEAAADFSIVILKRGGGDQPGPEVINAPGHVGFFAWHTKEGVFGSEKNDVLLLGGNQGNTVNITSYPKERILGIRSLDF